jgi:hypothetical protein
LSLKYFLSECIIDQNFAMALKNPKKRVY